MLTETKPNVLSQQGYFQRHFELCLTMSQQDAYEAVEAEYMALVGKERHKSYDAFRTAKSRYYNIRENRL